MTHPPIAPVDRLLEAATEQHRAGNLAEARRLYAEVIAVEPKHTLALFRSGLMELQDRRPDAALALIAEAASLALYDARYQMGLGRALEALERWKEAAAAYRRVLETDAKSIDAYIALGTSLQRGGQLVQAAAAYREALRLRPGEPAALGNLGTVLREMGDLDGAMRLLQTAAAIEPDVASHAINLGIALCQSKNFSAAEPILRSALTRHPGNAEAAFNLGNALRGLGRTREALVQFRLAAESRPNYAEALNNLGNTCKELGEFPAAMAAFDAALLARPDYVAAINNMGCLLRTLGRSEEAEDTLRRGLALDPGHASLHDNLGNVLKDAGALDEAIASFRRSLEIDPANAATHSNLAYSLSFQATAPSAVLDECRRWNERFAAPLERCPRDHSRDLSPARRLKVGYVSSDFREHCQSSFTLPLLAHHDAAAVEVFCYSSVERPDAYTRRIARHAHTWREVRALDDEALCARIGEDRIDILVDLTMHMANGRPLVFARKPAPVQIAWLAYPGTTGIEAIDYRLSDPRLDPVGFDDHYTERTMRLDDSFWCYDPSSEPIEVNPLPAGERGYVTFGCLNNPCKLTDRTLQLWGAVMRSLPEARLTLMAPQGRHRRRLIDRLSAHGIESARLSFVEFRPRSDYLRSYHAIDVGLDTYPYNGHTTSLDALWMGVPVVTRVGDTCVGRGGLSQLFQLELADLAAASDTAFIERAVALTLDLPRLAALRRGLRARIENSALMNPARFAKNIERAYRSAWTAYCGSPKP